MATIEVRVVERFAWWVKLYLRCVQAFAALHGLSPNLAKVERVVRAGTRVTVVDERGKVIRGPQ